jgi:hypothetical protein
MLLLLLLLDWHQASQLLLVAVLQHGTTWRHTLEVLLLLLGWDVRV